MRIIITGAAGFIGSNLTQKLLQLGHEILGIDIKQKHTEILRKKGSFIYYKIDILDEPKLNNIFQQFKPHIVIHLAALTGVRNSFTNAEIYSVVNTKGTIKVYQAAVKAKAMKFIFSSSSSVYGDNTHVPFSENFIPQPKSPYARSKLRAEITLSRLYQKFKLPTLVLRFFSVYGPFGRIDMAPFLFTWAALSEKPITKFGDGTSARDFTYIDDVVDAITKAISKEYTWDIVNIGNSQPVKLNELILLVQKLTGKTMHIIYKSANSYESKITYADITKAEKFLNWHPKTSFETGMKKFVNWYISENPCLPVGKC